MKTILRANLEVHFSHLNDEHQTSPLEGMED